MKLIDPLDISLIDILGLSRQKALRETTENLALEKTHNEFKLYSVPRN